MIKQNEIKVLLMYMEEICIIQIQRPSRAGALGWENAGFAFFH
jgi:hypothetical protein